MSKQLGQLHNEIMAAKMHYGIYHVFMNEVDRPKFVDVMNRFIEFFRPAINAHFVSMVTSLSVIYDQGEKSVHIQGLLEEIENLSGVDSNAVRVLKDRIEKNRPILKKMFRVRNNAIAHLSKNLSIEETFSKARLTRNDLRDLIQDTMNILQEIGRLVGEDISPYLPSSEDGTRAMLYELQMYREYGLAHPGEILSFEQSRKNNERQF